MTAKHVAIAFAAAALAASLSACDSSTATSQNSAPAPGGDALRSALEQLTVDGGAPGALALVQTPDGVFTEAAGTSDIATGAAMSETATTRIASVSKAFSGAVLLALVDRNELQLTDTIGALLPDLPAAWRGVTVAQLLQHTSGLPDYIKSPVFLADLTTNPQMQRTPQQLLEYVADDPLSFTPGTQYLYSDSDNIVAGLVAERVAEKPYDRLLADLVYSPLSLENTALPTDVALPSGFIHGYEVASADASPAPEDVSELINPGLAWASGGMSSTVAELNTFIRSYAAGSLVDRETRDAQRQWVAGASGPPGPGSNSSGMAIYRYETACGTWLGHTGNMPGYTLFAAADSTGQRSVVVAVNTQINPKAQPVMFDQLLAVENAALCTAQNPAEASASAGSPVAPLSGATSPRA